HGFATASRAGPCSPAAPAGRPLRDSCVAAHAEGAHPGITFAVQIEGPRCGRPESAVSHRHGSHFRLEAIEQLVVGVAKRAYTLAFELIRDGGQVHPRGCRFVQYLAGPVRVFLERWPNIAVLGERPQGLL